jgi:redox-sensitive bicupin YhaK (pirin superfamily)
MNASATEPVHFLQIWIVPTRRGLLPTYGQQAFDREKARGGFVTLASPDGDEGLRIQADASLYVAILGPGHKRARDLARDHDAWVQVARGKVSVNGQPLEAGDGAALVDETKIELEAGTDSEVLVFDLA